MKREQSVFAGTGLQRFAGLMILAMTTAWVASVEYQAAADGLLPSGVAIYAPHENDQLPIAVLPVEGRDRAAVEADAALMAAAPAMREALRAALRGDNQWREKAERALSGCQ